MKKTIVMVMLAGFATLSACAQESKGDKFSAEERAEFRAKRMKEHLKLTDNQYKQVYELNLEMAKNRETRKPQDFKEKQKEFANSRHDKYKEVLTTEQMDKLKSLKEQRPSAEKRAELQTNRLKEEVGLTPEQYKKLYTYHLAEAQKRDSIHTARSDKFKTEVNDVEKRLQKILTPEQYKQWKEERMEHHKGRR